MCAVCISAHLLRYLYVDGGGAGSLFDLQKQIMLVLKCLHVTARREITTFDVKFVRFFFCICFPEFTWPRLQQVTVTALLVHLTRRHLAGGEDSAKIIYLDWPR